MYRRQLIRSGGVDFTPLVAPQPFYRCVLNVRRSVTLGEFAIYVVLPTPGRVKFSVHTICKRRGWLSLIIRHSLAIILQYHQRNARTQQRRFGVTLTRFFPFLAGPSESRLNAFLSVLPLQAIFDLDVGASPRDGEHVYVTRKVCSTFMPKHT